MSVTATQPQIRPVLRAAAVIVPAHDEHELLGSCLDSLEAAAWPTRRAGWRVQVIVVADACVDTTRATARAHRVPCLTVHGHNVGAARAAGSARALAQLAEEGYRAAEVYLLHTDADTVVPSLWIMRHLVAAGGYDAVLGPVEVRDWTTRREGCARRYRLACELEPEAHRVHGANLGVRADSYLRAGGFPALEVSEDRALVDTLRAAGAAVAFRRELAVSTSARVSGRVHGGFSDFLSGLERETTELR
ncbi:MAG TPA: glycosyltransferase family 2 protein [Actinospica sp.]|nr:glycosyltransferase family 2 protein [Actinospica sp.]